MLLVTLALAVFSARVALAGATIPPRLIAVYAGIGCVVAVHWLAFYGSVKLANASVAATMHGAGAGGDGADRAMAHAARASNDIISCSGSW